MENRLRTDSFLRGCASSMRRQKILPLLAPTNQSKNSIVNRSQKNTHNKRTQWVQQTIFLDANVLIEIVLDRKQEAVVRKIFQSLVEKPYISALSAHLVVHFGRPIVELAVLRQFLADFTIMPLEAADFEWAFSNARNADFEGALQVAVAVRHGCSRFITLDKALYSSYKDLP